MAEARKLDAGKPRMDLIPPDELLELGSLFALGAAKYEDDNWRAGDGLEWKRLYAAAQRHLNQWWAGEDYDTEDGQPHLIAVMFCAMTLRWLSKNRKHMDPREESTEALLSAWEAATPAEVVAGGYHRRPLSAEEFEGDHGERRTWASDISAFTAPAEAPESPSAEPDDEAKAKLPLRILLGQRGVGKLAPYVYHQEDCQGFRGVENACTCGLDNMIKELRKA